MKSDINSLTGVRTVAALWVLMAHYRDILFMLFPGTRLADPFLRTGHLGVDLFFLLSGFIISYNYLDGFRSFRVSRAVHFLKLRFARIWPVHFLTLNLAVVYWVFVPMSSAVNDLYVPEAWFRNFFMVQAWFGLPNTFNGVSWSISAEWLAYLCFPFLGLAMAWIKPATRRSQVMLALAALLLAPGYYLLRLAGYGITSPLLRILFEFTAGCLLFRVYSGLRRWNWWGLVAVVAGVGIVSIACLVPGPDIYGALIVPLLGLSVLSLAFGVGLFAKILSTSAMLFWGRASYSLYMMHGLVYQVLVRFVPGERFMGSELGTRALVLCIYAATLPLVSAATYVYFEKPFRDWLRGARIPGETG
jgi:peptidoglycan/LPS O-acetylase OafA/YrhL